MRKKQIPNRKAKRKLRKLGFLVILFFSTIALLFSGYVFLTPKNPILISPVGKIAQKNILINTNDIETRQLQDLLNKNNIEFSDITIGSDSATLVTLKNGGQVVFSLQKKLDQQIASLQLIIRRLTIEGRRFTRIDFRFDNPIITF